MKRAIVLISLLLSACEKQDQKFDYELRVCTAQLSPVAQGVTIIDLKETSPCEPYEPLNAKYRTTKKICEDYAYKVEVIKGMEDGYINPPRRWRATCAYIGKPR